MAYFSFVQYEKILFDCTINLIHVAIYTGNWETDNYSYRRINKNKKYLLKKDIGYDEVTEDIFDMSNVIIFNKEIEKKKMGDVYTMYFVMSSVN